METLKSLMRKQRQLKKELASVELQIGEHPDNIRCFFKDLSAHEGFDALIGSLAFVRSYSEVEDWKVVYDASGYCFAFKDNREEVYYLRHLSANHGSHYAFDMSKKGYPESHRELAEPEWFYDWEDEAAWYAKILAEDREYAVAYLLRDWEGI